MNEPCGIEWITIPAPDLEAAKSFYANCFGFELDQYNERFVVFKALNLSGGLDQDLEPAAEGIGFSVTVPSMEETLRLVVENGGTVFRDPYELGPGAGYSARIRDPNGNALELYSEEVSR